MNTQKNSKVYWTLLKIFLNNKKIPVIPPRFSENGFITNSKKKAELFSFFFSKQCSLTANNSSLPADINHIYSYIFGQRFGKIIQNLDLNKAHGHDNIGIRILKIFCDSICVPLEMIFKQALLNSVFPSEWKKVKIIQSDKQNMKSYRPVPLLPICGKIFERLIFNEMFNYFSVDKLISKNKSGFQLLSITHEIFASFVLIMD